MRRDNNDNAIGPPPLLAAITLVLSLQVLVLVCTRSPPRHDNYDGDATIAIARLLRCCHSRCSPRLHAPSPCRRYRCHHRVLADTPRHFAATHTDTCTREPGMGISRVRVRVWTLVLGFCPSRCLVNIRSELWQLQKLTCRCCPRGLVPPPV